MNYIDILLILSLCVASAFSIMFIIRNKGKCTSCKNCAYKCKRRQ